MHTFIENDDTSLLTSPSPQGKQKTMSMTSKNWIFCLNTYNRIHPLTHIIFTEISISH